MRIRSDKRRAGRISTLVVLLIGYIVAVRLVPYSEPLPRQEDAERATSSSIKCPREGEVDVAQVPVTLRATHTDQQTLIVAGALAGLLSLAVVGYCYSSKASPPQAAVVGSRDSPVKQMKKSKKRVVPPLLETTQPSNNQPPTPQDVPSSLSSMKPKKRVRIALPPNNGATLVFAPGNSQPLSVVSNMPKQGHTIAGLASDIACLLQPFSNSFDKREMVPKCRKELIALFGDEEKIAQTQSTIRSYVTCCNWHGLAGCLGQPNHCYFLLFGLWDQWNGTCLADIIAKSMASPPSTPQVDDTNLPKPFTADLAHKFLQLMYKAGGYVPEGFKDRVDRLQQAKRIEGQGRKLGGLLQDHPNHLAKSEEIKKIRKELMGLFNTYQEEDKMPWIRSYLIHHQWSPLLCALRSGVNPYRLLLAYKDNPAISLAQAIAKQIVEAQATTTYDDPKQDGHTIKERITPALAERLLRLMHNVTGYVPQGFERFVQDWQDDCKKAVQIRAQGKLLASLLPGQKGAKKLSPTTVQEIASYRKGLVALFGGEEKIKEPYRCLKESRWKDLLVCLRGGANAYLLLLSAGDGKPICLAQAVAEASKVSDPLGDKESFTPELADGFLTLMQEVGYVPKGFKGSGKKRGMSKKKRRLVPRAGKLVFRKTKKLFHHKSPKFRLSKHREKRSKSWHGDNFKKFRLSKQGQLRGGNNLKKCSTPTSLVGYRPISPKGYAPQTTPGIETKKVGLNPKSDNDMLSPRSSTAPLL